MSTLKNLPLDIRFKPASPYESYRVESGIGVVNVALSTPAGEEFFGAVKKVPEMEALALVFSLEPHQAEEVMAGHPLRRFTSSDCELIILEGGDLYRGVSAPF